MRLPFTTSVVVLMLVVGVATGALWGSAEDAAWYPHVAYGAPSLAAGRWWTPVSGSFVAVQWWAYPPMVLSFAIGAGWAERVWGTWRAAVAVTGVQVAVVVAVAGLLTLLAGTGWSWAADLAGRLDVGFSAGALGVLAVLSGRVRAPLRTWLRLGLVAYVVVSLVVAGGLADVEHLLAVTGGLVAGSIRARREPVTGTAR